MDAMSETVTVTRGWGDYRRLDVPEGELSGFHMASTAGGTKAALPRPTLAAYMSRDVIPEDIDFAHSCLHGSGPQPPYSRAEALAALESCKQAVGEGPTAAEYEESRRLRLRVQRRFGAGL
jgi:hypothetical protein